MFSTNAMTLDRYFNGTSEKYLWPWSYGQLESRADRPSKAARIATPALPRGCGFLATLRVALSALRVNKLRSALTMLGISIGVGAVITMVAVGAGAQARVQDQKVVLLGQTVARSLFGEADPVGETVFAASPTSSSVYSSARARAWSARTRTTSC